MLWVAVCILKQKKVSKASAINAIDAVAWGWSTLVARVLVPVVPPKSNDGAELVNQKRKPAPMAAPMSWKTI